MFPHSSQIKFLRSLSSLIVFPPEAASSRLALKASLSAEWEGHVMEFSVSSRDGDTSIGLKTNKQTVIEALIHRTRTNHMTSSIDRGLPSIVCKI